MKFLPLAALALVAATAFAAPSDLGTQNKMQRVRAPPSVAETRAPGLIQNVGQLVQVIENGLGIPELEAQIDQTLGGHLVRPFPPTLP